MRYQVRSGLLVAAVALLIGASPAAAEQYVALGDSYSSGVGTREYFDSSCKKSNYAYPAIIDAERPNTELVFAACSGATTSDVLSSQVSSVTGATAIVTITIGGNDAGFADVITECALPSWASDCNGAIDAAQAYITGTLPGRLDSVYSAIEQRSPSATVVVLGYPRLFMGVDCNGGTWFSGSEMTRLNQTADMLGDVTRGRAQAAGFSYQDAIPPYIGHAVCSSSEWVNGLSNPVSESFHPNRDGQRSGYVPLVRAVIG